MSGLDAIEKESGFDVLTELYFFEEDENTRLNMIAYPCSFGYEDPYLIDSNVSQIFCSGKIDGRVFIAIGNPKYKGLIDAREYALSDEEKLLFRQKDSIVLKQLHGLFIEAWFMDRYYVINKDGSLSLLHFSDSAKALHLPLRLIDAK